MALEITPAYEIPIKLGHLDVLVFFSDSFLLASNADNISIHNHHYHELFYVISGTYHITVEGKSLHAAAGDFLLIHPGEYHCREKGPSSQFNLRFSICEPNEKDENSVQMRSYRYLCETLKQVRHLRGRDSIIFTLLNQFHKELTEKSAGYECNLQSLSSLVLTEIVRISGEPPEWFFPIAAKRSHDYDSATIYTFFSTHLFSKVKIQDLADSLKVSVRQVNRILHRLYGMSFTQKLTEMRLWEVTRQLTQTQRSITAISQDCGFNNYNYFYVCFREKFGMTPTEYRAQKTTEKKRKNEA